MWFRAILRRAGGGDGLFPPALYGLVARVCSWPLADLGEMGSLRQLPAPLADLRRAPSQGQLVTQPGSRA
jgi:hypothetical protein